MAASNAGGVRKKRDSQWISSRLVLDYHVWSPFEWSSIVYSMWADDHLVLKTRCTDTWTGRAMARIISTISTITGSYLWHKLMMICRRQIVKKIIFYPPFGDPWRYRHQKWRNQHLRWSSNVTQNFTTVSRRYLSPGKKNTFCIGGSPGAYCPMLNIFYKVPVEPISRPIWHVMLRLTVFEISRNGRKPVRVPYLPSYKISCWLVALSPNYMSPNSNQYNLPYSAWRVKTSLQSLISHYPVAIIF